MSDTIDRREVALTTDISFLGKHQWFNREITFLILGGCENVVNSQFAKTKLHLPIIQDDSLTSRQLQQSVNGHTFAFTELVEVLCNFKGYKEKIKFFLIDNLPHPFLLGYPFFKKRGAVFDLTKPTVTLSAVQSLPTIRLLGTSD